MAGRGARTASIELFERDRELAVLDDVLDAAAAGSGGVVVIEGAAGIGKSELVKAAAQRAHRRDMTARVVRAAAHESHVGLGIALRLAATGRDVGGGGPAGTGEHELLRQMHGLYETLAAEAHSTPLLLAVDDAHWADEPSLRFLLYVAHRIHDAALAVVVTARTSDEEYPPPLAALADDATTRSLVPAPLSARAVERMIADVLGDAPAPGFAAACRGATAGNPFLLRELLRTLADEDVSPTEAAQHRVAEIAPAAVRRRVRLRLARLGDACSALAAALAVTGDATPLRRVAALARLDADAAAVAADSLAAADIVTGDHELSYVHPLVRSAVYDDLPVARRARMHAEVARLLYDEGASPEAVASQLMAAARDGQAWAVATLRAAARRAQERGMPVPAAEYLRRALDEPPSREERIAVLTELADAEAAAADPRAIERLEEVLTLTEAPPARAEALLGIARLRYAAGDVPGAAAAFERALAEAEPDEPDLAAEARAGLAGARVIGRASAPDPQALADLVASVGDEPTPGQRVLLAQTALVASMALAIDRDEALDLCERALGGTALLEYETSDGMALYSVTGVLYGCDALEREVELMNEAIRDAQRRGSVLGFATASYVRASAYYSLGRLLPALADVEAALASGRDGWDLYEPAARQIHGYLLTERDDFAGAERALDVDLDSIESLARPMLLRARGLLRAEQGRWQEAFDDIIALADVPPFAGFLGAGPWRSPAAVCAARLGRHDEALALCDEELELARRWGAERFIGLALQARGLVVGGDEGVDLLREAVSLLERCPGVLVQARALRDLGSALRRSGARRDARRALEDAVARARRCGALLVERQASEELAVAGGRQTRRTRDGADALTPSERRVAEMAATGMTNRAIAAELFVTVKAIEGHLASTYRKLGISSRRELAAALGQPDD